jgi:hypothetical protein
LALLLLPLLLLQALALKMLAGLAAMPARRLPAGLLLLALTLLALLLTWLDGRSVKARPKKQGQLQRRLQRGQGLLNRIAHQNPPTISMTSWNKLKLKFGLYKRLWPQPKPLLSLLPTALLALLSTALLALLPAALLALLPTTLMALLPPPPRFSAAPPAEDEEAAEDEAVEAYAYDAYDGPTESDNEDEPGSPISVSHGGTGEAHVRLVDLHRKIARLANSLNKLNFETSDLHTLKSLIFMFQRYNAW